MKTSRIADASSKGMRARWRSPDLWAALLLVLAGILFFADFLFTSKNFYFRDILTFHYPLRRVLMDSYARWELPLWNPCLYLGQPMLANLNFMALYPTNILNALFSFNYAFKLHFVLHLLLAGPGLYLLQRRLRMVPVAAFGGALIYGFSGAVLSFLNLYNIVPAVALMPWMGWAYVRALQNPGPGRTLVFGLLVGVQVLSFEPVVVQCEILLLAGLSLAYFLEAEHRFNAGAAVLRTGLAGGLFGAGLSACQLLPAIELIPLSARGAGYDLTGVGRWSMHPLDLVNIIVPGLFGSPYTINRSLYWGEAFHSGREGYLVSFFLGAVAFLLIIVSFWSERRRLQFIFSGLMLLGIALALGPFNPVHHWLYQWIPGSNLARYPSKYFLLAGLSAAILAALGLELIARSEGKSPRSKRPMLTAALTGSVLGALTLGTAIYWHGDSQSILEWIVSGMESQLVLKKDLAAIAAHLTDSVRWSGAFFILAAALFFVLLARRLKRPASLFILLSGAELIPMGLGLSPMISEEDLNYVSEVNRYLENRRDGKLDRVISMDSMAHLPIKELRAPNRSMAWISLFYRRAGMAMYGIANGIQYSIYPSIDDLNTKESNEIFKAFSELDETRSITLLQRLNTSYLLTLGHLVDRRIRLLASFDTHSDKKLHAYRLKDALPRAYFVSGVKPVISQEAALEALIDADFPFKRSVILEDMSIAETTGDETAGEASIVDYRNGFVRCDVNAETPGYLVLLDSYYPGWNAAIDGARVPVLRANYAFRAVKVPAGNHRVEFRYMPLSFYAGLGITCLTVLLGGFAICWERIRAGTSRHRLEENEQRQACNGNHQADIE